MSDNTLDRLRSVGIEFDVATPEQRQVLASLSDQEVAVLTSVKERLNAAGAEVEGHMPIEGGAIF
jgi:hypothetical protein